MALIKLIQNTQDHLSMNVTIKIKFYNNINSYNAQMTT